MQKRMAALYVRVSTEDQAELSPDAQKRLLLEYAKKNDLITCEEFIFCESVSGRHAQKRPEFQKMIAMAKQSSHPFDVILVWKFSRFARNQEESIVYKSIRPACHPAIHPTGILIWPAARTIHLKSVHNRNPFIHDHAIFYDRFLNL